MPNPILVQWYLHNEAPPSADVECSAERVEKITVFLAQGFVLVAALFLARELPARSLTSNMSAFAVLVGAVAGIGWLTFYKVLLVTFPPNRQRLLRHQVFRTGTVYWLLLSGSSAATEELWRAVCLVYLLPYGMATAVGITAASFAAAHPRPLGRALSMLLFGTYVAALFLVTRSVVATAVAHVVMNWGLLVLLRRELR